MRYSTSVVHTGDEKLQNFNTRRYSTKHKRMKEYFDSLSDAELQELAAEKAPNRCATELAIEAQKYLYKRRQTLGY